MLNNIHEFLNMLPLVIVASGILISLIIEMFLKRSKEMLPWISIMIFSAAGLYAFITIDSVSLLFGNMLATGGNVNLFHFLFCFGAVLVTLLSIDYIKKYGTNYGEFYILLQCSVLGMMLMAGSKDLFVIFLGLEIMSISFYALAGINRKRLNANEASLKYFLLGSFATGFIVYGIALIYGTAMTTSIDQIIFRFRSFLQI
jgi:NADH-quinone oxidoreductase subunit N